MKPHRNVSPDPVIRSLDDLRRQMTRSHPGGAAFLDFILADDYLRGKGVWINDRQAVRAAYEEILLEAPHLSTENPYGEWFRNGKVRVRGENGVVLRRLEDAPEDFKAQMLDHARRQQLGETSPVSVFSGGPAAKIAAIIAAGDGSHPHTVKFVLDGAEQSNESGSASYEHVNHANALNAEHDNTGLGILGSALYRAIRGEPDVNLALDYEYRRVDLWPHAIRLEDIPIYFGNEIHGWCQRLKSLLGLENDHTKSRLASKASTQILSEIERRHGCSLRLDHQVKRAVFLYFTAKQYRKSRKDNEQLRRNVGLNPQELSEDELIALYGEQLPSRVYGADLFPENSCIRHGFDGRCREVMERQGTDYLYRHRIQEIFLAPEEEGQYSGHRAYGVTVANLVDGGRRCLPLDHLGLSLGPTATYHYDPHLKRMPGPWGLALPVPHQTIATGISAQVLFRITDAQKSLVLPFTGMKQTHFVELGRSRTHVVMKLTCGGVIGLPVYSRSYAVSALASLLRIIGPGLGLEFEDVVCAWPCSRGINPSNNGQVVRLANNAALRFAEGGTGMSKMGTNAQTLLDLSGSPWMLTEDLRIPMDLYQHTILDHRKKISRHLAPKGRRS